MKKILLRLLSTLKWMAIALLGVELTSFLVLTFANLVVYGSVWEGSRVKYDAYTLFQEGPRPTANNPTTATAAATPDRRMVWMFGGSTMRGSTEDDAKTIPSVLASLLNRSGAPLEFTVRNFGENSFNSLLETRYLQKALIEERTHPDLVIFYDGANEAVYFSQYRTPYAHHGYQRVRALIESHRRSAFGLLKPLNAAVYASFTWELYGKLQQTVIPIEADSPELHDFVERTVRRYDYVDEQAGFYGAEFLLFWQPILWTESCELPPTVENIEKEYAINRPRFAAVRQNFQVIYRALGAALRDRPYFVDLQSVLCSRTEPVYKPDGVHLLDRGREMVAREMGRVLEGKGLATR